MTLRPPEVADSVVNRAARGLTRRRVFRNLGGAALGASMTAAYIGTRPEVAAACTYSNVCGPAPKCTEIHCENGGHRCKTSRTDIKWAHWGSGSQPCAGQEADSCWNTCAGGFLYRCCDCCNKNPDCTAGATCTGCGTGNWHKCSCQSQQGTC